MAIQFLAAPAEITPTVGSWEDVDATAHGVPAGASGVIVVRHNTGTSDRWAGFRKNGSTDEILGYSLDREAWNWDMVGVDASGIFEAYRDDTLIRMFIMGWTESETVHFTNAVEFATGTTAGWQTFDLTAHLGADAGTGVGALIVDENPTLHFSVGVTYAYRTPGSTQTVWCDPDDYERHNPGGRRFEAIALDSGDQIELNVDNATYGDSSHMLAGYIKASANVEWFVDRVEIGTNYQFVWTAYSLPTPSGGGSALGAFVWSPGWPGDGTLRGIRKAGETYEVPGWGDPDERSGFAIVEADASGQVELRQNSSTFISRFWVNGIIVADSGGGTTAVDAGLTTPWDAAASVDAGLTTPYGAAVPVESAVTTPFAAAVAVSAGVTVPWGGATRVLGALTAPYGIAEPVTGAVTTPYAAATPVQASLTVPWDAAVTVAEGLTTPWDAAVAVTGAVTTPFAAAAPVTAGLTAPYTVGGGLETVTAGLTTPYAAAARTSDTLTTPFAGAVTVAAALTAPFDAWAAVDGGLTTPWTGIAATVGGVRVSHAEFEVPTAGTTGVAATVTTPWAGAAPVSATVTTPWNGGARLTAAVTTPWAVTVPQTTPVAATVTTVWAATGRVESAIRVPWRAGDRLAVAAVGPTVIVLPGEDAGIAVAAEDAAVALPPEDARVIL